MSVKRPQKQENHYFEFYQVIHIKFNEIITLNTAHIYEKIIWFQEEKETENNTDVIPSRYRGNEENRKR